eukprot:SAG11_NODE_4786_length_1766_cov_2.323935_2_plen_434_part_00
MIPDSTFSARFILFYLGCAAADRSRASTALLRAAPPRPGLRFRCAPGAMIAVALRVAASGVLALPNATTARGGPCVAGCGPSSTSHCTNCSIVKGMDWSCDVCCPGCQAKSIAGGHYCACNGPPPPPSPGGGYVCYQKTCYEKAGGKQTKAQCDATCAIAPAPPGPVVPGISQTSSNMTWAGKQRQYMSLVPVEERPTGLIVVLDPVLANSLTLTCPQLTKVALKTGAVVVCPAALSHLGTKPPQTPGACWKAWDNFGTCGATEDSEDVDFLAALIRSLMQVHRIPPAQEGGKIIMSGMSNGGSMAFRFNCERSELIGGLAIQSQAYFDPYVRPLVGTRVKPKYRGEKTACLGLQQQNSANVIPLVRSGSTTTRPAACPLGRPNASPPSSCRSIATSALSTCTMDRPLPNLHSGGNRSGCTTTPRPSSGAPGP